MQSQRKKSTVFFPGDFPPVFLNIFQVMLFRIMRSHLKKIVFERPGYGNISTMKSRRLDALRSKKVPSPLKLQHGAHAIQRVEQNTVGGEQNLKIVVRGG